MDRRKSIKTILIGGVSVGVMAEACQTNAPEDKAASDKQAVKTGQQPGINRMPEENAYTKDLEARPNVFTEGELATIGVLADIIIPKDDVSGSATDAGVPAFIEFIAKDMPEHETPMKGGLRWLELQSLQRYDKNFRDLSHDQRMAIVDDIAWPEKAKPEMSQGVAFFNLMRNLTITGFYTSQIGVKDIGYVGNQPNKWNGVPDDVLKKYGLAYTEKDLKECAHYE